MTEALGIPDRAARDPLENAVWDALEAARETRKAAALALGVGYVRFEHPRLSGSVQPSGPPPLVRLGQFGGQVRGQAPALVLAEVPRGFGQIVEWALVKAVERYEVCGALAADPQLGPAEAVEASQFQIPWPEGCAELPGRGVFLGKLQAARAGNAGAQAEMRGWTDRTALCEFFAQTPHGRLDVEIDGRGLPLRIIHRLYQRQAQEACWALRAAGAVAQQWGDELVDELFALSPGMSEFAPDTAGAFAGFCRGLPDWPSAQDEDVEAREEFLQDLRCARIGIDGQVWRKAGA